MSASAQGNPDTKKAVVDDKAQGESLMDEKKTGAGALEEDDEFEDFPVEGDPTDWEQEDAEIPAASTHLWEESWDDDDTSEDFSVQLKEELKKVEASKRG
ncbi:uncharacterized protein K452DRAFT_295349 [Aplosporella prunicola CBS 121167]|uniref:26S proteasome complex subunit SEM1 n=1 Tax=Aplosporella prunicola CBS 121167 TaxID=1176127 RepID=A0A6A6BT46_9PEZI|nr:uncharacterized protein K452DRAFT_295349 [Aplosporella prunicola CBS 121167]KAF2145781.1 hypothetical protein K452DRAFT_295349 [Aplosporella prunicola CBS 121167]